MPEVKALKSFQGTAEEGYVKRNDKLTVTTARQRELAANGLVPKPKGDADPLDHDGNGERGGSKFGAESTASKGAAAKKA